MTAARHNTARSIYKGICAACGKDSDECRGCPLAAFDEALRLVYSERQAVKDALTIVAKGLRPPSRAVIPGDEMLALVKSTICEYHHHPKAQCKTCPLGIADRVVDRVHREGVSVIEAFQGIFRDQGLEYKWRQEAAGPSVPAMSNGKYEKHFCVLDGVLE